MPVAAFIVTCDALDSGTTHACNLLGQSCQHVDFSFCCLFILNILSIFLLHCGWLAAL